MGTNRLLELILDIGEQLSKSGAESRRVEDSITRMCQTYGFYKVQVFCITSIIIVTIKDDCNTIYTQTRRIDNVYNNFTKLEQFNSLSRYICENAPDEIYIRQQLKLLENQPQLDRQFKYRAFLGYALAGGSFAIFFGGNFLDVIPCVIIGLLIAFSNKIYTKSFHKLVYSFLKSFIIGFLAWIFVKIGIGQNYDDIIITSVVLLIPGVALTNSVRDMLGGDTLTGFLRMIDAILISISIAGGFICSLLIMGGL